MTTRIRPDDIVLVPMAQADLHRLAASEPLHLGPIGVPEGALPPPRTAVRALAQLQAGAPPMWCVPYLIVPATRDEVWGGCGFKFAPRDGSVEISYGVARSQRGRGVASAAVSRLLDLAMGSGIVDEVVAHILPDNIASTRVVEGLGFARGPLVIDHDGEAVVRWSRTVPLQAAGGSE